MGGHYRIRRQNAHYYEIKNLSSGYVWRVSKTAPTRGERRGYHTESDKQVESFVQEQILGGRPHASQPEAQRGPKGAGIESDNQCGSGIVSVCWGRWTFMLHGLS